MIKVESGSRQLSCFTIGHSDLPVEVFINHLHKNMIDCVVDVRSSPYSKYSPQYNRGEISRTLERENIEYHYMGDVLGGRYSDPSLLFPDGTVDYQKVARTHKFISGLNKVISLIESGKIAALMCSEKDPLRCHRFVLVARNLQSRGVQVIHLYRDGGQKTHADLETRILNEVIDIHQVSLVDGDLTSLDLAYIALNKKIGYNNEYLTQNSATQRRKDSQTTLL